MSNAVPRTPCAAMRPAAVARLFSSPESQVEFFSLYYQEQKFPPARFCNIGIMKKTGASVVHGAGYGTRPPASSTSSCLRETLQRRPPHACRSTSYTVCRDKFSSLAISVIFFHSAFILRIMPATAVANSQRKNSAPMS